MIGSLWRALSLVSLLLVSLVLLASCSGQDGATGGSLFIPDVTTNAQAFAGKEITVEGAYVWRPGDPALSVLAAGVSTLDNGLDARPMGDPIWVDEFPNDTKALLHQPGDSIYGFVRVTGRFEAGGGFGPDGSYQYRMDVQQATFIEEVRWVEHRLPNRDPGVGTVSFFELQSNPERYHGQTITTRGYYFWNSVIYVLAEGVRTTEEGGSPQPIGAVIWMEGFPPDKSAQLNLGPNNTFVWGLVEVTGTFQTGGGFGRDGAYQSLFLATDATPLEPTR